MIFILRNNWPIRFSGYTKISRCLRGLTITTQNHFNNYYLVEQLNIHAASIERLDVMRKIRTYVFFGAHNYHSNRITIVRCDWLNPMAFEKTYFFIKFPLY